MDANRNGEIQLVVFHLGDEEFGVDISQVREIIKMSPITRIPNSPLFIEGVISLRGNITTVMDLRKRLNLPHGENSDHTRIIIIEFNEASMGMVVDSVTEVLRIPTGNIEPTPTLTTEVDAEYIQGVGKVEGVDAQRLLIILDLTRVLSSEEMTKVEGLAVAQGI